MVKKGRLKTFTKKAGKNIRKGIKSYKSYVERQEKARNTRTASEIKRLNQEVKLENARARLAKAKKKSGGSSNTDYGIGGFL